MHLPLSAAAQPLPGSGYGHSHRSADDRGDDPDSPQILSVAFESSTIRSDRVAVAKLECVGVLPEDVSVHPVTPGFEIQLLEERAMQDGLIIVGLRIHRRIGAVRRLCLVRFSIPGDSAIASITVLH